MNPGTRLGAYEVIAKLGEGGMGEVYKARDTRLGRTVAIKVLPADTASDPAHRERFKREGEAIAAVSSPHICALYDVDRHGDRDVLVMEYVDGESLDVVLRRGPLPFAQAGPIAVQIARALDAAHAAGIVHRDLKPSNIMLGRGNAKVLDFGVAKLRQSPQQRDATHAATLTSAGSLVGTLAYMSPEQLQGLDVDVRTDIYAFGAVVFEMLTGIAAASAPADVLIPAPPTVQWLIRRCLERDRDSRWQSAHDAAALIQAAIDHADAAVPPRGKSRALAMVALAAVVAFALGATLMWLLRTNGTPPSVSRLSIVAPTGTLFTPIDASGAPQFALSPDGNQIAFVAGAPGAAPRIWVRSLITGSARALDGTNHGASPFWSQDSRAIGFFTRGKLSAVDLSNGQVRGIVDVTYNVNGASWGAQGIVFGAAESEDGIVFAPAAGGVVRPVTRVDRAAGQIDHRRPQFLPDGRHFIYYAGATRPEVAGVYIGSLDDTNSRQLLQITAQAHYVAPHWLLFERGGILVAQRFDVASGTVVGQPITLPDRVTALTAPSALLVSGSENVLALWEGARPASSLEWIDRNGRPGEALMPSKETLHNPTISPDGQHVLVTRLPAPPEPIAVWRIEIKSGRSTRLTFTPGFGNRAVWSPDGTRIAVGRLAQSTANLFLKPSSGAGADEPLPLPPGKHYAAFPTQWTPHGQRILYQATSALGWDLWAWDLSTNTTQPIIEEAGNQTNARVSPNGRWLAYGSDTSGTWQVYVEPFLAKGGKWQVSETSGSQPLWRADGRELYYLDDAGTLYAATVREQPTFEIVDRTVIAHVRVRPPVVPYPMEFAAMPDGQRFLVNREDDEPTPPITIILNWQRALGR